MSFMATYKLGQGAKARTLAGVVLVLSLAWGCMAFLEYGNSKLDRLLGMSKPVFGKPFAFLPADSALTSWVTPSFAVTLLVFVAGFIAVRKYLNRPAVADHLIGTELEMRRVKWPTRAEVSRAGSMVVFYTFWLAVIIFLIDITMSWVVGMLIGKAWDAEGIGRLAGGIFSRIAGN
jgi:preprotein translocase SecE subunit